MVCIGLVLLYYWQRWAKRKGLTKKRGGHFPLVFFVDSLATSFISLLVFSLDPPRRSVCSCCSDRRLVDSIRSARIVCCAFADNSPIVFVASFQCVDHDGWSRIVEDPDIRGSKVYCNVLARDLADRVLLHQDRQLRSVCDVVE